MRIILKGTQDCILARTLAKAMGSIQLVQNSRVPLHSLTCSLRGIQFLQHLSQPFVAQIEASRLTAARRATCCSQPSEVRCRSAEHLLVDKEI